MKRLWLAVVVVLVLSVSAGAAVFEKYLSPSRPADRAILAYLDRASTGQASSDDLTELAVLLYDKGFPKDAERYLRDALKLDKKNAEAAYRLGLVLQRMGRYGAAVRAYKRAVQLRPGHTSAQFMLALALEHRGRRQAAIYHYAKCYRHAPEFADPAFNPLVLDSKLQAEAQLLRYKRDVEAATLKVAPVHPSEVRRMMMATPGASPAAPAPPPAARPAAATPAPVAVPAPTPPGATAMPPADSAAPAPADRVLPGYRPRPTQAPDPRPTAQPVRPLPPVPNVTGGAR